MAIWAHRPAAVSVPLAAKAAFGGISCSVIPPMNAISVTVRIRRWSVGPQHNSTLRLPPAKRQAPARPQAVLLSYEIALTSFDLQFPPNCPPGTGHF